MMGLDHTDVELDFQQIEWLKACRDEKHITAEICEKILWRNADRLIGLGLADAMDQGK
jgi:predicted TIM-barrel fold metal-dependent hydrolase